MLTKFYFDYYLSGFHTRNFRLTKHFSQKLSPVSPLRLAQYWSHTSRTAINKIQGEAFVGTSKDTDKRAKK